MAEPEHPRTENELQRSAGRATQLFYALSALALLAGMVAIAAIQIGLSNDRPNLEWYTRLTLFVQLMTPVLILSAVLGATAWMIDLLAHSATRRG